MSRTPKCDPKQFPTELKNTNFLVVFWRAFNSPILKNQPGFEAGAKCQMPGLVCGKQLCASEVQGTKPRRERPVTARDLRHIEVPNHHNTKQYSTVQFRSDTIVQRNYYLPLFCDTNSGHVSPKVGYQSGPFIRPDKRRCTAEHGFHRSPSALNFGKRHRWAHPSSASWPLWSRHPRKKPGGLLRRGGVARQHNTAPTGARAP